MRFYTKYGTHKITNKNTLKRLELIYLNLRHFIF